MKNNGYVILISVLILGAVGASLATAALLYSAFFSQTGILQQKDVMVRATLNNCLELGLQTLRTSSASATTGTSTINNAVCTYSVIIGSGQNRSVYATSTISSLSRSGAVQVTATSPSLLISSWLENQ